MYRVTDEKPLMLKQHLKMRRKSNLGKRQNGKEAEAMVAVLFIASRVHF
jgi:hypothetical protein